MFSLLSFQLFISTLFTIVYRVIVFLNIQFKIIDCCVVIMFANSDDHLFCQWISTPSPPKKNILIWLTFYWLKIGGNLYLRIYLSYYYFTTTHTKTYWYKQNLLYQITWVYLLWRFSFLWVNVPLSWFHSFYSIWRWYFVNKIILYISAVKKLISFKINQYLLFIYKYTRMYVFISGIFLCMKYFYL